MKKVIKSISERVFRKNNLSVVEFIKKHKIDELPEEQMEDKLLEIIYSKKRFSWYSKKSKQIAMLLMGNHIQDKETRNNKNLQCLPPM
ncbi:hypothetical protein LPB90_18450 [Chryseobacterium sp. LC2016-29]|uniref:hypothetical protein n=1 Tax=Chryseobacterium sp. LC2016-29 TaxID=2897331 RepID=UPI001E585594|nr:hypothetical protein [Chryseobacterium sp. LC2016-29]MCD0480424.1 hypothetical protein [Chryseobacterium sp. LC2016-29]